MRRSYNMLLLCLVLASPLLATNAPASPAEPVPAPITPQQVANALAKHEIKVTPDEVELLSPVMARSSDPDLTLVRIEPSGQSDSQAVISCESTRVCLPFFVLLHGLRTGPPKRILLSRNPSPILIRSGDPVVLVYQAKHMSFTQPVVSLQNGALGQTIRVRNTAQNKVHLAQVVRPGVVYLDRLD